REVVSVADHPEFASKSARLALMDDQGVEAAIMLPTMGVSVEYDMRGDPGLLYASLRAFNRWLEEDWGYGADGRIFAVPMLSLVDLGQAMRELRRVLDAGARRVPLAPGPVCGGPGGPGGRSPADPEFDPFWGCVAEAGIPVVFHVSNSGYNHFYGTLWSEKADTRGTCSRRCSWRCAIPSARLSTR